MGAPLQPQPTPDSKQLVLADERRLVLGELLGSGASTAVYRATLCSGTGVCRPAAVRLFNTPWSEAEEGAIDLFSAAACAAAALHHPNVVSIMDFGFLDDDRPFVYEEYIPGMSLETFMVHRTREGTRVPLDLALFIGVEVAEALHGARLGSSASSQRLSLHHGDLSARKVLLSHHGEVKVTGFGLGVVKQLGSWVRNKTTATRAVVHLAPEVVRGEKADARSDVFSLGILLWELLVGPRFHGEPSHSEVLVFARDGVIHSSLFDPLLPSDLRAILRKALAPAPEDRYEHGGELAYDLRRVALAMGVGDGRTFLREALQRLLGSGRSAEASENVAPPALDRPGVRPAVPPLPLEAPANDSPPARSAAENAPPPRASIPSSPPRSGPPPLPELRPSQPSVPPNDGPESEPAAAARLPQFSLPRGPSPSELEFLAVVEEQARRTGPPPLPPSASDPIPTDEKEPPLPQFDLGASPTYVDSDPALLLRNPKPLLDVADGIGPPLTPRY